MKEKKEWWRRGRSKKPPARRSRRARPRTGSWLGMNMAQSPPAATARAPMSTKKVSKKYRQPMKSTAKGDVPRDVPPAAASVPPPAAVPLYTPADEPDVHHTSAMFCTLAPPTAAAAAAAVTAQRAMAAGATCAPRAAPAAEAGAGSSCELRAPLRRG